MRKSFVLILLMLILSVVLIAAASGRVNEARDAVSFDEQILSGSRDAADGLELGSRVHSDYRLFWDTSCEFDDGVKVSTDFRFSQAQEIQPMERVYNGVSISMAADGSASTSGSFNFDSEDIRGLTDIYKDVASRTGAGEERTEIVRLGDYYDFYPLSIYLDLPAYWVNERGGEIDMYLVGDSDNNAEWIHDYFKIPVASDYKLEAYISKNDAGEVYSYGSRTLESGQNLWSKSVLTDRGCYFVLSSRTLAGTAVDTSHITGGYGIYKLAYYEKDGHNIIPADSLSMIYKLAPGVEILEFVANDEQSRLLLLTVENQKCVLTVIDTASMSRVQKLELFEYPNDIGLMVYPNKDFMVLMSNSLGMLAVAALRDTGEYGLDFITKFADTANFVYGDPAMAYDGRRLAVVSYGDATFVRYYTPSFNIAIYDESGLAYYGSYKSSLDVGWDIEQFSYQCSRTDNVPMSVRWKS